MKFEFETLKTIREFTLRQIEGLTVNQFNTIPKGFKNNIIWNLGHLVVTQQLLVYKLSGNKPSVSLEWINTYGKNSTPSSLITQEEINDIKTAYINLIEQTKIDFNNNLFKSYTPYPTSMGIKLNSATHAITFNNTHEGVHSGIILALKKLV
jgi:hypothetical protein